jgi:hypothetical protein
MAIHGYLLLEPGRHAAPIADRANRVLQNIVVEMLMGVDVAGRVVRAKRVAVPATFNTRRRAGLPGVLPEFAEAKAGIKSMAC